MSGKRSKASKSLLANLASVGEPEKKLKRIRARTTKLLTGGPIDVRGMGYFLAYLQRELAIEVPES